MGVAPGSGGFVQPFVGGQGVAQGLLSSDSMCI